MLALSSSHLNGVMFIRNNNDLHSNFYYLLFLGTSPISLFPLYRLYLSLRLVTNELFLFHHSPSSRGPPWHLSSKFHGLLCKPLALPNKLPRTLKDLHNIGEDFKGQAKTATTNEQ
jgi:hypothetical protein